MVKVEDLRFVSIKLKEGYMLIPDTWKVDFWVSAGELTPFYEGLEQEKLMGTRCPSCGSVYCWPRSWCHDCYEDCEWMEMTGKGGLTLATRAEISLTDLQEAPFIQGGVHLDGARYPMVAMIKTDDFEKLHKGMRMRAEFKPAEERLGRIRDFYFVPDE